MNTSELIEILKNPENGYPNSEHLYTNPKYVDLVSEFLILTSHISEVSKNANEYALMHPQEKEKRSNDRKLIHILDNIRDDMWEKIVNFV